MGQRLHQKYRADHADQQGRTRRAGVDQHCDTLSPRSGPYESALSDQHHETDQGPVESCRPSPS